MDQWPDAAKEVIAFQVNHLVLLALDAAESDTYMRRSLIAGAGRGVFAARDFVAGEYILPFFGQVIYHDLGTAVYQSDPDVTVRR